LQAFDISRGTPAGSSDTEPVLIDEAFIDEVAAIIREVGTAEVVSRFRSLATGDVVEKSPGDLVTVADRECERVLSERLRNVHNIPTVGEESVAADHALVDLVATAPAVWIIDPVDGTSNFVAGNPNFVVMVALLEAGQPTAAWVWHPETDSMLTAQRGKGTFRDGIRLDRSNDQTRSTSARGILKRKFMNEPERSRLAELPSSVGTVVPAAGSAGIEYGALADGAIDFLMYWRTLPWDHAPGSLIAEEAGLRVARIDGAAYVPGDGQPGLLAATRERWPIIAAEIQLARGLDAASGIDA